MRTVKFITLGCKVNQYEAQEMREVLCSAGLRETGKGEKADLYVLNTCTVTHRADAQCYSMIRKARRENPLARIIAAGCLSERDAAKLLHADPGVEILSNAQKKDIAALLGVTPRKGREGGITAFAGHVRSFLKIQDGCNNRCAYCKVRLVRGPSRSRPLQEIVGEARRLVAAGFKEIVLTGICVGAYGVDLRHKRGVCEVIEALETIQGLQRIRVSSIELTDVNAELVRMLASGRKLCPHLHIPLQSGDDTILRAMRRKYTYGAFVRVLNTLFKKVPDFSFSTDILVGFPGEGKEQFAHTRDALAGLIPLRVHVFPYSRRPGTDADTFPGQVDQGTIAERCRSLKVEALRVTKAFCGTFFGRDLPVLCEKAVAGAPGVWEGYTHNYMRVRLSAPQAHLGDIVRQELKPEMLVYREEVVL